MPPSVPDSVSNAYMEIASKKHAVFDGSWQPLSSVKHGRLVAIRQVRKRFILQRFQCGDKGRNVHRTMIANTLFSIFSLSTISCFTNIGCYLILTAFVLQGRAMLQIID